MQNDVLKNEIAPWQEKGRWYHEVVESDGSTWSIITNESDNTSDLTIAGARFLVLFNDIDHKFIDLKILLRNKPNATIDVPASAIFQIRWATDRCAVYLPPPANCVNTIDLWIYVRSK